MEYYAIGDSQFFISHHGVMGMHWGVRRFQPYGQGGYSPKSDNLKRKIANTKAKIERNNNKIEKLNDYSHSKKQAKLAIKETKLRIKRSKYDKKVNTARRNRELYDEDPSWFQRRALKKAYKLDTKISKLVRKQSVWKNKVSKLEYKNMKLENKVNKYIKKLDSLEHTATETNFLAHYGKKGMQWGKHKMASSPYWLTDQQAKNMAAGPGITDQQEKAVNEGAATSAASSTSSTSSSSTTYNKEEINKVVDSVINGNFGNGEARKSALAKAGYDYAEVQNLVNEKLGSSKRHESSSSSSEQSASKSSSSTTRSRKKGRSTLSDQQAKNRSRKKSKRKRRLGKNILLDQQRDVTSPNLRREYVVR